MVTVSMNKIHAPHSGFLLARGGGLCLVLILHLYLHFLSLRHYFDLHITDTALKVCQFLYCFTTSISQGVEKCGYGHL